MNSHTPTFDVGIIGGGPAGSVLAAYLTRAGIRCVILERERVAQPQVGESLVPSSNGILKDIGVLEQVEAAKFTRKYGAAWTSTANLHAEIQFTPTPQSAGQAHTYHVDRAVFDQLLLEHAARMGATVHRGVTVTRVDFADPDVVTIKGRLGEQPVDTHVRLVVDASGRRTLLGTQLGLKVKDPVFDQFALHAWFEGFDRGTSDTRDFIVIHFLPITNTWVWQIPITETITSIGVVTQKRYFAASRASREAFFWDSLRTRPELFDGLRRARQMSPLKEEGDYSYAMRQICGDRFLLIGDAARFVDPIFSSGVGIALYSAQLASADILQALGRGSYTRDAFARYETTMVRGMRNWYEMICLYYRLNVLFTVFLNDPKYQSALQALIRGDVYDEESPWVLQEMRTIVNEVERNPKHLWHRLLGDLTANAFRPHAPWEAPCPASPGHEG